MTHVYGLAHDHRRPLAEVTALIGGKAANLGVMARELDLPVPPGFAITTEACGAYLAGGWPDGLDEELRTAMAEVEAAVGRRFGDPADPLLVSVRSGAPVSMPGMMDTILDLGLTDASTAGLAAVSGDPAFAADCQRRFREMFRRIAGVEAPDDPRAQLRLAIEAVFRSWNSDRAIAYRRRESLPDDVGTGVTVQAMVFGNRGPASATGVVFTRDPATGEPGLYGDVLFSAQGEDVVAGTHATQPLAVLDDRLPDVGRQLREAGARLERHYRDLCDIEFTIEADRLWLLQVRVGKRSPRAALRMARDMAEDASFPLTRAEAVARVAALLADPPRAAADVGPGAELLVTGLPASPGVASGEIVTSPEGAVAAADAGRSPILVRAETSPDDVPGMARSVAIVTAAGGLASHAAVVARGWGIPAVVGAAGLEVSDDEIEVGGRRLAVGEVITVDGGRGSVYVGPIAVASETVPEAAELLDWARELGIGIETSSPVSVEASATPAAAELAAAEPITTDECVQVLRIKGLVPAVGVADALLAEAAAVQPVLDRLVADGLVQTLAGAYRLTDDGQALARRLLDAEQESVGPARAVTALDAFVELDRRVKEAVTDWQLRPGPDGPAPNDHADAAYDAAVLARLVTLHREVDAWIGPLEAAWPRSARYRRRLGAAAERAVAGDGRYVASPRVDSYHGVWFELHEDLIQLAGRTRADEVAAGRA